MSADSTPMPIDPSLEEAVSATRASPAVTTEDDNNLPAPFVDIFATQFWPVLPSAMGNAIEKIFDKKLDIIMAYTQDNRKQIHA